MAAIAAGRENVTLPGSVTLSEPLAISHNCTIDLNGETISNTNAIWKDATEPGGIDETALLSVRSANTVTIKNGTFDALQDDCYGVETRHPDGKIIIESGEFIGNVHAVYCREGEIEIKGGRFSIKQLYPDANKGYEFTLNCKDDNYGSNTAKITVTGGVFKNFNPANNISEGVETNYLPAGYKVVKEGTNEVMTEAHGATTEEIWYEVVPV